MSNKISKRFSWAVEVLHIQPDDTLLEIGCGHGIALGLIAPTLTDGSITAIDRSEKMIKMTHRRNSEHVATGKVNLQTVALKDAQFDQAQFNKIFAINVNVFWQKPAQELAVIRQFLHPAGTLYLFYQPPRINMAQSTATTVEAKLKAASWVVQDILIDETPSDVMLGILARLA